MGVATVVGEYSIRLLESIDIAVSGNPVNFTFRKDE